MSQTVHGHEILERLVSAGGNLALSALRDAATRDYGEDAKYFTCSAQGMSFDELLEFLSQRNKIAVAGDRVTVFVENICKDGDQHHRQH
jgi:probable metal-binding protein